MSLVALGVTGGIGAYKAVEIARGLQKRGHDVVAVMTRSARRFVGPLTFEAITGRRVIVDQFAPGANANIEHIALASEIDLLLVAPATANIIGKFANGIADDFLSSLYLATRAPVVMAPAMNTNMLEHEAVRRNLATLTARGVRIVEPGEGDLACGWIGKGRLAEPDEVVAVAEASLKPSGSLSGTCIVVTAGPTYEDIDPVRYFGNRSSGRMGFALAAECARRGAKVVLIAGPSQIDPPTGVELVKVRSAAQMKTVVMDRARQTDAVIMAAAIADYTVKGGAGTQKIPKGSDVLKVTLVPTVDILAELGRMRGASKLPVLVGFAAETTDLVSKARAKLLAKKVDLIVANDVSRGDAGFESETNAVTIVSAEQEESLPLELKTRLAATIVDRVERRLASVKGKQAKSRPAR